MVSHACLQYCLMALNHISYSTDLLINATLSSLLMQTGGHHHIPESRAVVGQDDQLGFSLTDHLLGLFVAQDVFSTLHHQLEPGVNGLHGLFLHKTHTHTF